MVSKCDRIRRVFMSNLRGVAKQVRDEEVRRLGS